MIYAAALCFIIAMAAGMCGYAGVAQDMAFNGKLLGGIGILLAILSFLARRGRAA